MAAEDPFASIVDHCVYSSSQDDIHAHSKFAREGQTFPDEGRRPWAVVGSHRSRMELAGAGVAGGNNRDVVAGGSNDCKGKRVLGFPEGGESSTIEVVFGREVRISEIPETESERARVRERESPQEGSSIELPSKKSRVSGSKLTDVKVIPLVQCSERVVIDSEDESKQIVVLRGGVKIEIVSPLRCFAQDAVECTKDEHAAQDEISGEKPNQSKKKLEFSEDTEVIKGQEEETNKPDDTEAIETQEEATNEPKNGKMGNDVDKQDGNAEGAGNRGGGSSKEVEAQDEIRGEKSNQAKKKLEFRDDAEMIGVPKEETHKPDDIEVIKIQEEETNAPKKGKMGNDVNKQDGNGKDAETRGGGSSKEIEGQGKRQLPSSLLGQIWGLSAEGIDGSGNRGFGAPNRERGERSVEKNECQKSKTYETLRQLLHALKMLSTQTLYDAGDGEIDIIETAKRRGIVFPCSRFRVDLEKD